MADDLTAELERGRRIADGLAFACRLPDRKPDFTFCGGPAAQAYWEHFTPDRVTSLLDAVEAVLKLGDRSGEAKDPDLPGHVDAYMIREAISRELTGKGGSDA